MTYKQQLITALEAELAELKKKEDSIKPDQVFDLEYTRGQVNQLLEVIDIARRITED